MRFCHECGATVAPEDVFCSYCGVSLQLNHVAPESPDVNVSNAGNVVETTSADSNKAEASEGGQTNLTVGAATQFESKPQADVFMAIDNKVESDFPPPDFKDPAGETPEDLPSNDEPETVLRQSINLNNDVQSNDVAIADVAIASISEEDRSSNNPFIAAQPQRPAQNNISRPLETPSSKSSKLKLLDNNTVLNRRYEIVRRIGGGGMGAVYLAKDLNLGGVPRAVKEMIQAYVDESQQEKAVQDFRRESLLLSQLEHPGIPTIYDYFYDEDLGRFYLVMKYISGGDLAGKLRATPENRIDEGSVTEWAIQIADVLDYLHNQQPPIVYRDLKPSNIMLDASGKAMLIDFGIARWVKKEEKGVTAVGTMGYAPPELFAGNADPRSDIYSLGATMFHLLTGADPQSNPLLIFDFTKNPRPRDVNPSLSVEIEDILLRTVEYSAGQRFESAAKMREALQKHLANLRAGRLTFVRKTATSVQPAAPSPRQPVLPAKSQPGANLVFCGFCGEKIVATDLFCAYCGAPQQSAPPSQSPPAASAQLEQTLFSSAPPLSKTIGANTARLIVLGTQQLDEPVFPLEKDTNLIGREDRRSNIFPEIDLTRFDDPEDARISRRHARIWREGASFMIEDLKSANGTILIFEDNQVLRLQPNQPHALNNGDKLKLGKTTLRFHAS